MRRRGDGDLEGAERLRVFEGPGEGEERGGGVGIRTAEDSSIVSAIPPAMRS